MSDSIINKKHPYYKDVNFSREDNDDQAKSLIYFLNCNSTTIPMWPNDIKYEYIFRFSQNIVASTIPVVPRITFDVTIHFKNKITVQNRMYTPNR